MARFQPLDVQLTDEQLAEAERIERRLLSTAQLEVKRIARLLASKPNGQLFGQTESELRDRRVAQYFRNHQHQMENPRYVENSWQIGSGPVESSCKTIVGNRSKGSGMRWGEAGSDAVCHLRALFLSEPSQWRGFWRRKAA